MRNNRFFICGFLVMFCFLLIPGVPLFSQDAKFVGESPLISPSDIPEATEAYNEGTRLMRSGDFKNAEPYLKKAIELDPGFVDAYDHLGIVYRRLNRPDEALDAYFTSIKLNSEDNYVPYINIALIYQFQNKPNESIAMYQKAIDKFPENPEGYYGVGNIFVSYGYYKEAVDPLVAAARLYKEQESSLVYDAYFLLGISYYYLEEWDEAKEYLDLAKPAHGNDKYFNKIYGEIKERS